MNKQPTTHRDRYQGGGVCHGPFDGPPRYSECDEVGSWCKTRPPQNQSSLVVVSRPTTLRQFVQHEQICLLAPLALVQAPVLIPTLQQMPLIEMDGTVNNSCETGIQPVACRPLHEVRSVLEFRHVRPHASIRVQLDPVMLHQ
jgi:hypothetical protein